MNKKLIRKMLTAAGGPLQLTPEELKYLEWSKMTPLLKREYRNNRINAELQRGPNIKHFWEAFQTYIGNRDPENPYLQTGDVPTPGMRNPKLIILGILKVKNITKSLWNNGKLILKNIPYNPENFYRGVSKEAIKDARTSGIIRSKNPQYLESPYFSQGKLFWNEDRVIEGTQGPVLWVKASGPHGEYNSLNIIKPGEKSIIGNGSVPSEVFPYLNGSTKVPTTGFSYWKKHPIIGWRKYSFKQGGKMNTLEFLKNGSGIHIKKKNRGSFTRWCGGNVTEECIRRGKASSNPKIRKKATFADNARHFKHKSGGKAFIKEVNVLDSNPDAYKLVKKKVKMRLWGGDITINESPIVLLRLKWLLLISDYNRYKELLKLQLKITEEELKALQRNNITNTLTGIFELALPYLTNSIGKKSTISNNAAPSNTTGTSSTLTNIGNNNWLSANLDSMKFFGFNNN